MSYALLPRPHCNLSTLLHYCTTAQVGKQSCDEDEESRLLAGVTATATGTGTGVSAGVGLGSTATSRVQGTGVGMGSSPKAVRRDTSGGSEGGGGSEKYMAGKLMQSPRR